MAGTGSISSVFLMSSGCQIPLNETFWGGFPFSTHESIEVHGFRIAFVESSIAPRPSFLIKAVVKRRDMQVETEEVVGSSNPRWTPFEIKFLSGPCVARDNFILDYRYCWQHYLQFGLNNFLRSACVCAGMFAIHGGISQAKNVLFTLAFVLSLTNSIAAEGYFQAGMLREFIPPLIEACLLFLAAMAVAFLDESLVPTTSMMLLSVSLLARIVEDCFLYPDPSHLLRHPPVFSVATLALVSYVATLQRKLRSSLAAIARDDALRMEVEWAHLPPAERVVLARLDVALSAVEAECPQPLPVRQLILQQRTQELARESNTAKDSLRTGWFPSTVLAGLLPTLRAGSACARLVAALFGEGRGAKRGTAAPVPTGMDQIYAQAVCAAPRLLSACRTWAAGNGRTLVTAFPSTPLRPHFPKKVSRAGPKLNFRGASGLQLRTVAAQARAPSRGLESRGLESEAVCGPVAPRGPVGSPIRDRPPPDSPKDTGRDVRLSCSREHSKETQDLNLTEVSWWRRPDTNEVVGTDSGSGMDSDAPEEGSDVSALDDLEGFEAETSDAKGSGEASQQEGYRLQPTLERFIACGTVKQPARALLKAAHRHVNLMSFHEAPSRWLIDCPGH